MATAMYRYVTSHSDQFGLLHSLNLGLGLKAQVLTPITDTQQNGKQVPMAITGNCRSGVALAVISDGFNGLSRQHHTNTDEGMWQPLSFNNNK